MVEASRDMYSFDHNGCLQTEKAVAFVRSFFDRCLKQFSCSNEITLVVFSRLYYPQAKSELELRKEIKKKLSRSESYPSLHLNDVGAYYKTQHSKFF